MHSSLANLIPQSRADVEDTKREGWREQGILVISHTDERLDDLERLIVQRIGKRLYGDVHG